MAHVSDDTFAILARAADLRRAGVPFALATVTLSGPPTSARAGARAIVTADGALYGWIGGACSQPSVVRHALDALRVGEPQVVRIAPEPGAPREGVIELPMTCHSGGAIEVFIEPFLAAPRLVVIGDTPVAGELCAGGARLGFEIVALVAPVGDSDAGEAELVLDTPPAERQTYVVAASMGACDEAALLAAARRGVAYIALVGSRHRFAAIADYLRARGVGEEVIGAIRCPAGLDIRATMPAEIALSILAEITVLRRSAAGHPSAEAEPAVVVDPVCGMPVDLATATHTLLLDGVTYGFCCPMCKRAFARERGVAETAVASLATSAPPRPAAEGDGSARLCESGG